MGGAACVSLPNLSFSFDYPLVGGKLLKTHRTARPQLLRAYAYLGSEAELCAVSEAGRRVPVHAGSVDLGLKLVRTALVLRYDALAVARTEAGDVLQRRAD